MGMLGWFKRKAVPERTTSVALVEKFVSEIETGVTDEWCKCRWRIHPDDQGATLGTCVLCGTKRNSGRHHTLEGMDRAAAAKSIMDRQHRYRGVRKVKVDTHPHCPVHTKEGLIIRFLEWSDVAR